MSREELSAKRRNDALPQTLKSRKKKTIKKNLREILVNFNRDMCCYLLFS